RSTVVVSALKISGSASHWSSVAAIRRSGGHGFCPGIAGVAAELARLVEGEERVLRLPARLTPAHPLARLCDVAEVVDVFRGEAESDAILQADALVGTKLAQLKPASDGVGDLVSPDLPQRLQSTSAVAGCRYPDGTSSGGDAIRHVVIADGACGRHHDMTDVIGIPSGAGEHSTDDERTPVA